MDADRASALFRLFASNLATNLYPYPAHDGPATFTATSETTLARDSTYSLLLYAKSKILIVFVHTMAP